MTRPVAGRAPVRRARPATRTADLAARLRECQRTMRPRLVTRSALAHVLQATHVTLDPRRVAEFLVSWAPTWWPVPIWAVVTADVEGQIAVLAEHGLTESLEPVAQAVGGRVMHGGEDFASRDLSHDARLPGPAPAMAALGFLLRGRETPVGALIGLDRRTAATEPALASGVQEAWAALLGPAALALENATIVERAEALSVTDDLTRLYNSRYLNLSLRRETKRAVRTGRALSLLFIDLDGFKAVNDTYGHMHGSRALVEAAAVIRTSARETDVVARFGGDEFAVILPETARDGAIMVAERIRDRIAAHSFLTADLLDVRLTASVGIATLPDVAASAEELMQAADRAMYKVKVTGKNGIHLAAD
jgi:diguanylate cyclase (GGDEF)-like protein